MPANHNLVARLLAYRGCTWRIIDDNLRPAFRKRLVITTGGIAGRKTVIKRAGIVIAAIHAGLTDANAIHAGRCVRAHVIVVADIQIVFIGATDSWFTKIGRALVAVITFKKRFPGLADTAATDVVQRAGIIVITGQRVVFINAADSLQTTVRGTRISIVAIQHALARVTRTCLALVFQCAGVSIVARRRVRDMDATIFTNRNTAVVGALIIVIAILHSVAGKAGSKPAAIPYAADIPVVAGNIQKLVDTSEIRMTGILGTRILIPASDRGTDTLTVNAKIIFRAQILVIAHAFDRLVNA